MKSETDIHHLQSLSVDWMEAWKAGDTARLESLLAPEFELVVSAALAKPLPRSEWLRLAVSGYVCRSFRYKQQNIRVLGDFAVVASLFEQEASVNGQDRSGEFFLTDFWHRHKNSWQVVARYSSMPEAVSASSSAVAPGPG
jgi:ketosteroid isomerase-like protein